MQSFSEDNALVKTWMRLFPVSAKYTDPRSGANAADAEWPSAATRFPFRDKAPVEVFE